MKKYNFSAGPATLPTTVIQQASMGVLDLDGIGLSVLEISHRSAEFGQIIERAEELVRKLLRVPEEYAVLFLTGGASTQFFMVPMNLLAEAETASYVLTGSWAKKAYKEAQLFGNVEVAASSEDQNFSYIPRQLDISSDSVYLHYTSNNTIYGTQFHQLPDTDKPLVADMSSDIFSRPVDIQRHWVIYAGAQKNMGPAGTTLVIIRKDVVERAGRTLPTMLNYKTHIEKRSLFNTPPVFPIYVSMLTLAWVDEMGGVERMAQINKEKAALLYREIDDNPLFYGVVRPEDRSVMNVCFRLHDEKLNDAFLAMCSERGIVGIKGHRSVGGFRASIYNAMPIEGVQLLVETMRDFAQRYG